MLLNICFYVKVSIVILTVILFLYDRLIAFFFNQKLYNPASKDERHRGGNRKKL